MAAPLRALQRAAPQGSAREACGAGACCSRMRSLRGVADAPAARLARPWTYDAGDNTTKLADNSQAGIIMPVDARGEVVAGAPVSNEQQAGELIIGNSIDEVRKKGVAWVACTPPMCESLRRRYGATKRGLAQLAKSLQVHSLLPPTRLCPALHQLPPAPTVLRAEVSACCFLRRRLVTHSVRPPRWHPARQARLSTRPAPRRAALGTSLGLPAPESARADPSPAPNQSPRARGRLRRRRS